MPSVNLNPDVCGYSATARNISAFINEGLQLPNKITAVLSDLKGNTNIADNLKANKAKWYKERQAELAPSKLKCALKSMASKKRIEAHSGDAPYKRTHSSLDTKTQLQSWLCLFCNEPGLFRTEYVKMKHSPTYERMSKIRTDKCDDFIRNAAADMGDALLLAKFSEGNLFARDADYHINCIAEFRH